jgi:GTP-binding protein
MSEEFNKKINSGTRAMFRKVTFVKSASDLRDLPDSSMPEIAFAGRSNVGKSSLLNAVAGIKRLAKVSNTPGRTQLLNYFTVDDEFYLVDLPGYGYAKASKTKVEEWNKLVRKYLRGRANLRLVLILIDSRHGLKDSDREVMKMLDEAAVSYQIVLTKLDKLRASEEPKLGVDFSKHAALQNVVLKTSSEKGTGIAELQARMAEFKK